MSFKFISISAFLLFSLMTTIPLNSYSYEKQGYAETSIVIKGRVRDPQGVPVAGATISVKGSTLATISDDKGDYVLNVPNTMAILRFSFIGYVTQERKIKNNHTINVQLQSNTQALDEVVVVGYGVQKKSDLTGAISSVSAKDLPVSATTSVDNMLAGKVAGMQVSAADAQPGGGVNILIRGAGSVNSSNAPLYVIDGFPINDNSSDPDTGSRYHTSQPGSNRSPLSTINPNDIQSIEVLKDASATAIYGARAANGVILITTKQGKEGRPKVSYDMKFGIQKMTNDFTVMNGSQWYQANNVLEKEKWLRENKIAPYGNVDPNGVKPFQPPYSPGDIARVGDGTDWTKQVTQTGIVNEQNISVSGATKTTNYLASVNYYDQKGVLKNNTFTRFSGRLNLTQHIRKWLSVGLNTTGSQVKISNPALGDGNGAGNSGILELARTFSPDLPVRGADGKYSMMPNSMDFPNPVSVLEISNKTVQKRLLAQAFAEFKPIDGLTIRVQAGIDSQDAVNRTYIPTTTLYGEKTNGDGFINNDNNLNQLLTITGNYQKTFNKIHHIDFLLGYEWNRDVDDTYSMEAQDFVSDATGTEDMNAGSKRVSMTSHNNDWQVASYFGRFNYSLMDKYLFSFSVRRDGSDKFGKDNRWGIFPAGAFAWRMNQENFLKDVNWLSNLKLRLSAGQTGNSNILGSAFGYYGSNPAHNYIFGNNNATGEFLSAYANYDLRWETTTEYNLGLDVGFLKNRLNFTLELYDKEISDLIQKRTTMYYLPGEFTYANIGSTSSKGFDLNINSVNVDGEFTWTTGLNLSAYVDKWNTRDPTVSLNPYESEHDRLRVDWGYVLNGLVQPGEKLPYGKYGPGSQKVKDLNGDGVINANDMVKIGDQDPHLIVGFVNNFSYKNFDLSINMYGMFGMMKYNPWLGNVGGSMDRISKGYNYAKVNLDQFWSSQHRNAKYPNVMINDNASAPGSGQFAYQDASFMRIKNITLGYNFSGIKKVSRWVNQLRLYVDVANPVIFTKFTHIDPEYTGEYPPSRTITFGLNFQF